ncbi:MAG: threonine ammonia-lyase [Deltaproteobacteria bacterium]|nr:threonine ammonia-lyase [Deltaproteobacteria bacterium]
MVTLTQIEEARKRTRDAIYYSPLASSEVLSEASGNRVFVKLENLQMTGSFKERGALNKMLALSPEERARGVFAASAGNHAQGVAYHARRLGIQSTIVMPSGTPLIKLTSTRGYGAHVILNGPTYDDAYREARRLCDQAKGVFIHAFDDPDIIAGQGTCGLEILEQNPEIEAVVVPVGGGGLIGGIALAVKQKKPKIRVIGVQSAAVPSMIEAVRQGKCPELPPGQTMADGIAVRKVGEQTLPLVQKYVDAIVTVDEEEIANAILFLLEREKTVAEGAGAVGVAALLQKRTDLSGKKVAVVVSGGNIDVNILSRIIEKGLVKDGRLVKLRILVSDRPGGLSGLTRLIAESRANIMEIVHNRAFADVGYAETEVAVTLETRGPEHVEEIIGKLRQGGYRVTQDI